MPTSDKRIAANRANATLSTGPTSPAGKRISSRNGARKSDISRFILIDGESSARFDAHLRAYEDEFQPTTPTERTFVESMVVAKWHQSRVIALHSAAINYEMRIQRSDDTGDTPCTRAMLAIRASAGTSPHLELLSREQTRLDRQYNRALLGLTRFRAEKYKLQGNSHQSEENKGEAR
jgi:hypothetical protein